MTRTVPRRVFNALIVMVFLLFGAVDLSGLRPCPHHDSFAAIAAEGHMDHPSADEAHAGHQDHAESDADTGEDSCVCKRLCPGITATPLAIHAPPVLAHRIDATVTVVLRDSDTTYPRFTPFFLPYAQAPPRLC
jgi:hypothetical protein